MTYGVFIVAKQRLAKPYKQTLMLLSTSTVTQSVCLPGLQRSAQNLKTKHTHAPTATSWCMKSCAKDMMWLRCWGKPLSWTFCTELQLSDTRRLRDSALCLASSSIACCCCLSCSSCFADSSLWRSSLAPSAWPNMADPIVKKMTVLGMPIPWRVMATNGMVAWTARNHSGENFLVCSRHMPKGTLSTDVPTPSVASLTGRA